MTEITFNKNIYVYGKFYDTSRVLIPKDEQNWDVIVYAKPLRETSRIIGSLEGYFYSEEVLDRENGNPLCRRDEMKLFEEKYKGKFIPFEK